MKCKDCDKCKLGWFPSKPEEYVCIGVKEPFVIGDINVECTEYSYMRTTTATIQEVKPAKAFVDDDGIYVPSDYDFRYYKLLISRELFVEAYNKWINNNVDAHSHLSNVHDDADCWCE